MAPGAWPGTWPAWKARRVADETISHALTADAAAHVDRHLAPVAHKIGATGRRPAGRGGHRAGSCPRPPKQTRRQAADGRHFTIDHDQVSFAGTSWCTGSWTWPTPSTSRTPSPAGPAMLKDLGCAESLDVRRAMALGDIARHQLALDLTAARSRRPVVEEAQHRPEAGSRRPVDAVRAPAPVRPRRRRHRGRAGGEHPRPRSPPSRSATWCGHPDAQVTVKPVIDLADHVHVEAYEVPDRIAEAVALRDHACVFPWCTRPARRLHPDQHGCDCDHVIPHARGGADLHLPARAPVPTPPPAQDPRRLDLHHPRTRHLPLVEPAPLPVPPRPHRHPRRHPRPPRAAPPPDE